MGKAIPRCFQSLYLAWSHSLKSIHKELSNRIPANLLYAPYCICVQQFVNETFFYGITADLENRRHWWWLCFNEKKFAASEPLKKVGLLECKSIYKRNSKLFVIVWLPSRNQWKMLINSGNWHVDLDQTWDLKVGMLWKPPYSQFGPFILQGSKSWINFLLMQASIQDGQWI